MKVLSLFSGIGGFDLGFERAGMEVVGMCEIDKHAQGVLQRQFPNAVSVPVAEWIGRRIMEANNGTL